MKVPTVVATIFVATQPTRKPQQDKTTCNSPTATKMVPKLGSYKNSPKISEYSLLTKNICTLKTAVDSEENFYYCLKCKIIKLPRSYGIFSLL